MQGNKSKKLIILEQHNYNTPKMICFSEKQIITFENIKKILKPPLICRSSFSVEDSDKFAFAGVFDSFFPVYNKQEYLKGIKKCLESDKKNRFKMYTQISGAPISLTKNIIVQEFIIGDFSGVCFTKSLNRMLIEIVPGINEPLVQGTVNQPFTLSIGRKDLSDVKINNFYGDDIYTTIKNKKRKKILLRQLDFEENIMTKYIDRLVEIFLNIEKLFGTPQDIEFTVKGKKIYILQSRNITIKKFNLYLKR